MTASHLAFFLDLNRAAATAARRFDAELGSVHGLGLNDFQLLYALDLSPGRRLKRNELARALGLTPSGVTWILRPLVKRRLVTSQASSEDARVAFAALTEAGHRLVADALPSARRFAAELLEERVTKDELARAAQVIAGLT